MVKLGFSCCVLINVDSSDDSGLWFSFVHLKILDIGRTIYPPFRSLYASSSSSNCLPALHCSLQSIFGQPDLQKMHRVYPRRWFPLATGTWTIPKIGWHYPHCPRGRLDGVGQISGHCYTYSSMLALLFNFVGTLSAIIKGLSPDKGLGGGRINLTVGDAYMFS